MNERHKIRKVTFDISFSKSFFVLLLFLLLFALPVSYYEELLPLEGSVSRASSAETYTSQALAAEGRVAGVNTEHESEKEAGQVLGLDLNPSEPGSIAILVGIIFAVIAVSTLIYLAYTAIFQR